jgi:hypothetical protein
MKGRLSSVETVSFLRQHDDASIRVLQRNVNRTDDPFPSKVGINVVKTQSTDTHPEIERIIIESYRRMSPAERFKIMEDLTRAAISLTMSGVRANHPGADETECRLRAASRWLDPELMRKAYGWDPELEGY